MARNFTGHPYLGIVIFLTFKMKFVSKHTLKYICKWLLSSVLNTRQAGNLGCTNWTFTPFLQFYQLQILPNVRWTWQINVRTSLIESYCSIKNVEHSFLSNFHLYRRLWRINLAKIGFIALIRILFTWMWTELNY